jgi:hypothetical protein
MQYRLCWMIDGDEQVDHRLWPNKIVPEMVRNYLQEQFPAMEVRIEELEDNEETGNCNEGQEGKSVRQEGGQDAPQEGWGQGSAS